MSEFWIGFIIGLIIILPICIARLVLYFKYGIDTTRKGVYKTLSPFVIIAGIIYGFFDEK